VFKYIFVFVRLQINLLVDAKRLAIVKVEVDFVRNSEHSRGNLSGPIQGFHNDDLTTGSQESVFRRLLAVKSIFRLISQTIKSTIL
jgi:hypothetical protein